MTVFVKLNNFAVRDSLAAFHLHLPPKKFVPEVAFNSSLRVAQARASAGGDLECLEKYTLQFVALGGLIEKEGNLYSDSVCPTLQVRGGKLV